MSVTQIPTSVSIIASLKGFISLSMDPTPGYSTAEPFITAGSIVEVNGAFFQFTSDTIPSDWSAITTSQTAYINLAPSGTAGSQILTAYYTQTAPVWRDDLQGWYASAASNIRVIGSIFKSEATVYSNVVIFKREQKYTPVTQNAFSYYTSGATTENAIFDAFYPYLKPLGSRRVPATGSIVISANVIGSVSFVFLSGNDLYFYGANDGIPISANITDGDAGTVQCSIMVMTNNVQIV